MISLASKIQFLLFGLGRVLFEHFSDDGLGFGHWITFVSKLTMDPFFMCDASKKFLLLIIINFFKCQHSLGFLSSNFCGRENLLFLHPTNRPKKLSELFSIIKRICWSLAGNQNSCFHPRGIICDFFFSYFHRNGSHKNHLLFPYFKCK